MKGHFDVGDIEQALAHLAVGLREGREHRIGFADDAADGLLEELEINRAVNFTKMPSCHSAAD